MNFTKILKLFFVYLRHRGLNITISLRADVSTKSSFEGFNKIHKNVYFKGHLGMFSYIGANSYIDAKVGRFTSIAPNVRVLISSHPYTYPYVSTSPVFISTKQQSNYSFVKIDKYIEQKKMSNGFSVEIGNDCWIGDNVLIVSGITIGDGAVVLAGAVVTKNIPPYAIVGGVPAKILKYRYSDEDIKYLLNISWWNRSFEWLRENAATFHDFESFKNMIK